jgi:hypothetical protein
VKASLNTSFFKLYTVLAQKGMKNLPYKMN